MLPELSVIVLPDVAPADFVAQTREAEAAGVRRVWTYDHLSWRDLRDGPWHATVPLLTAAALATERVRIGPQVASPNFRHPVTFAKEVMTLDHLSGGRVDLGIGAGTAAHDAQVLGEPVLTPRQRQDRFEEWTGLLGRLLRGPQGEALGVDHAGEYWTAVDARTIPGCVQAPRVPFTVGATGPRGMRHAARTGAAWVSIGAPRTVEGLDDWLDGFAEQAAAFDRAQEQVAAEAGADATADPRVRRIAQIGLDRPEPFTDAGTYADVIARLSALGYDEVSIHWPRADGRGVPAAALDAVVALHAV
ncbi:LLM class flavin-dependent oxidoreductase [Kineococcus gynurae]|uniref:LLM class flavin-dependent oxidoreductase n=1 Tax=Kineococcus gynurae TaxID=452979 RepID=A0ABV5LRM8_9ACTN